MSAPRQLKRIAVLVSVGRNPVSGALRYSRNDAVALKLAVSLRIATLRNSTSSMRAIRRTPRSPNISRSAHARSTC